MFSVCVLKLKVQFCTQWKRFKECTQNLTFHVGRAKESLWLRLCRNFVLQNVGGSGWVQSQKWLSAWWRKDWHGLHESSYCYFKEYAGTVTLKLWVAKSLLLSVTKWFDLYCVEFSACHDKGECGWVLGEGLNFQLEGLRSWVLGHFPNRRSTLTRNFVESCVDFEVAH